MKARALSPRARRAFERLADAPPSGTLQLWDGLFTALAPGAYTLGLTHTVTAPGAVPATPISQAFEVTAPEFALDPGTVQDFYPADGGYVEVSGDSGQLTLPYISLADVTLPWERPLTPGAAMPDAAQPTPWLALMIFAEGEIYLDSTTNSPLTTVEVQTLLAGQDPNVLGPQVPTDLVVPASVLTASCQTITIPGAVFEAVAPALADLPFLVHCQAANTPGAPAGLVSTVLCNRLAVVQPGQTATRYYAHLVSLEGFQAYLNGGGSTLPDKPGLNDAVPVDVQLVSLANWSFTAQSDPGTDFAALAGALAAASQAQAPALAIPLSAEASTQAPQAAIERLQQGYAPLSWITGTGDESFAWYRGPFCAAPAQPLPGVGADQSPVAKTGSSDALMIYLADQGLFDLSYASAWLLGRALALADGTFIRNLAAWRLAARAGFATLAQRMSLPHLDAQADARDLLAAKPSRRRFAELIGQGLGRGWTEALKAPPARGQAAAPAVRPRIHPRDLLGRPEAVEAVAEVTAPQLLALTRWLVDLTLLKPVPFSALVPDPAMLPPESIRFFYLDSQWIEALVAGALSPGMSGAADAGTQLAFMPRLKMALEAARAERLGTQAATGAQQTGVLIRSQLNVAYPQLSLGAGAADVPLALWRDDCPSPSVRLCLIDGVPDTVTLAEPYQGLRFGTEDGGLELRSVAAGAAYGQPTGSTYAWSAPADGVIPVADLAGQLATALGAASLGAGDFALQMIQAPEAVAFTTAAS